MKSAVKRVQCNFRGYIHILVLIMSWGTNARAIESTEGKTIPVEAHVVWDEKKVVPTALGGASIQLTFKENLDAFSAVADEICALAPPVLRFPSGMHAMFYDWQTGKYSQEKLGKGRVLLINPIDSFFEIAEKCKADVSYIVNVYQDPPKKTRELAKYLALKGYAVRYWELGNEADASILEHKFPDANAYLAVARQHADEIKSVFPQAAFGVTAQSRVTRTYDWNRVLANQDYFKNIIIHRYHGPKLEDRRKLAQKGSQVPVSTAFGMLMKNSEVLEPYAALFPHKNIWITEWAPLYLLMDIQNSMGHALWMARVFLRFMRAPEIKMATYWNLNAVPFEMLADVSGRTVHRVPFYVYRLIITKLQTAVTMAPMQLSRYGRAVDLLDGQLFIDKDGRHTALIINATGKDQVLKLPTVFSESVTVEVIASKEVAATNGLSRAFSPVLRNQDQETVMPALHSFAARTITLPPYAIAVVAPTMARRDE